jgi:hypothetical protein
MAAPSARVDQAQIRAIMRVSRDFGGIGLDVDASKRVEHDRLPPKRAGEGLLMEESEIG